MAINSWVPSANIEFHMFLHHFDRQVPIQAMLGRELTRIEIIKHIFVSLIKYYVPKKLLFVQSNVKLHRFWIWSRASHAKNRCFCYENSGDSKNFENILKMYIDDPQYCLFPINRWDESKNRSQPKSVYIEASYLQIAVSTQGWVSRIAGIWIGIVSGVWWCV